MATGTRLPFPFFSRVYHNQEARKWKSSPFQHPQIDTRTKSLVAPVHIAKRYEDIESVILKRIYGMCARTTTAIKKTSFLHRRMRGINLALRPNKTPSSGSLEQVFQ